MGVPIVLPMNITDASERKVLDALKIRGGDASATMDRVSAILDALVQQMDRLRTLRGNPHYCEYATAYRRLSGDRKMAMLNELLLELDQLSTEDTLVYAVWENQAVIFEMQERLLQNKR